jgi:membrane fusion protein (multidrug efflux system)
VLVVGADDKAEVRRVETGARVGVLWEVISGVTEGQRVIYEGLQKVQPGAAVTPTERSPAAPSG